MSLHELQVSMLAQIYSRRFQSAQNIYIHNTYIALSTHLQSIYTVCHQMVGPVFFKKACYDYIQENRLKTYDITFYGEGFSHFLAYILENKLPGSIDKNSVLKGLPDLAQWEWAIHFAQCGLNHINHIGSKAVDKKNMLFPSGSSLVHSYFPLEEIWAVHKNKKIDQEGFMLKLNLEPKYWYIGLLDGELSIQNMTASEFVLLANIKNKGSDATIAHEIKSRQYLDIVKDLAESLRQGRLILA